MIKADSSILSSPLFFSTRFTARQSRSLVLHILGLSVSGIERRIPSTRCHLNRGVTWTVSNRAVCITKAQRHSCRCEAVSDERDTEVRGGSEVKTLNSSHRRSQTFNPWLSMMEGDVEKKKKECNIL
ncbi:unnamed protein product [Macrosiphum euphorbiae]|uniref:Uncharacterized protein n=1 Tax=Macrosiphum euphorbiae TaxID=13131 RepID=A0AAV0W8Q5_9HEMI|nr:unnamed protein product [Macrosiphum euphorbiae]